MFSSLPVLCIRLTIVKSPKLTVIRAVLGNPFCRSWASVISLYSFTNSHEQLIMVLCWPAGRDLLRPYSGISFLHNRKVRILSLLVSRLVPTALHQLVLRFFIWLPFFLSPFLVLPSPSSSFWQPVIAGMCLCIYPIQLSLCAPEQNP